MVLLYHGIWDFATVWGSRLWLVGFSFLFWWHGVETEMGEKQMGGLGFYLRCGVTLVIGTGSLAFPHDTPEFLFIPAYSCFMFCVQ